MKKDYNQFTKSDMPLDSSLNETSPAKAKTTAKPKINVIGPKKTTKSATAKTAEGNPKKGIKAKLASDSVSLKDLEKLNEDNIKQHSFRIRRNAVIIAVLAILLVVAITVIIVYTTLSKLESNCFLHIQGDATCSYVIDGKELEDFRTPSNLQGNRILEFDAKVKIESSGEYYVKFKIECYQGDELLKNTLIYEPNLDLFESNSDGYYYSHGAVSGNQTISLCRGAILDLVYEKTLNVNNFRLEMTTIFEKVS